MKTTSLKPLMTVSALITLGVLISASSALGSDTSGPVTFNGEVLSILQENCQTCHRPSGLDLGGMVAPMSFMTYEETRPWARSIARQVQSGTMPPWHASEAQNGVFENERRLSAGDSETLVRWAKTGAQRGDPVKAPAAVEWPSGEWGFEPDLVVEMTEPYWVEDEVEDLYVDIPVKLTREMLPEPRWIRMAQAKGGSRAVHHIIARPLGGLAPGSDPYRYPEGYGVLVEPETTVVFQMHYHKEPGPGTGVWDRSSVAVKFHTEPVQHPIATRPIGNVDFEIPAGHPNWRVGASRTFNEATTIMALLPHMHLRGKSAKYTAFYPDGSQEVLLEVPNYDFNWQTRYLYKEPKQIPAGTRVEFEAHYDNSAENPSNPDPGKSVRFGEPTTDEMMLGWMSYTPSRPAIAPRSGSGATGGGE